MRQSYFKSRRPSSLYHDSPPLDTLPETVFLYIAYLSFRIIDDWKDCQYPMNNRLPPWIKRTLSPVSAGSKIFRNTYAKGLHTVCKEARCPNRGECESRGTATFLILGDQCTRNCGFCAVQHGKPAPLNPEEAELIAEAVANLGLRHAVITSVTRDDLPDGGASVFVQTVQAIRKKSPWNHHRSLDT